MGTTSNFFGGTLDAQNLLLIAADYVEAGNELDGAVALGIEVEDRRPAVAEQWAAALTQFVDSRIKAAS